jgi:hypothetical protein
MELKTGSLNLCVYGKARSMQPVTHALAPIIIREVFWR